MSFDIEFKKKCLELMASPKVKCEDDGTAGVVVESGMDWESSEEMAVIVAPKAGKQLDPKFTSHQFKQQNIITISRRIAQKDFEAKLQSICSCPNLRVLCMSGFGDLQNKEQTALNFLTEKLPSSCPKIRHFILDDGLLDLAIAYQETFPDNISVIEVRHVRPETEEAIIHLVTSGRSVQSVHLDHSSVHMIQEIVPVVRSLSLCWITDGEFKSLIKSCPSSDITELRLETVDLTMNSQRIEQLASVLPQLQLLKLSAQLENIGSLKAFRNLRHVIFDGECDSKPGISPFFEIDISHALQVSRQQDDGNEGPAEEDNRVDVQQSLTSQAGLDEFMINCGSNLVSFNITIRDRFKRDLFQHLKKSCPRLQELTILSTTEQFFDTKSLSVPSLRRLRFQFINMNDAKLVELLDYCRNLQFISIDKPQKITCASIKILALYSEDVFCENDERLIGNEKFTAIILTEGKEDMTRDLRTHCAQITYRQNAVVEVSNRLRYKY